MAIISSSSSPPSDAYIPYAAREEYSDVVPIPQQDAENPLVMIMYSEEYSDASSYFRALSSASERSPRVLSVTEHIIRLNPAHYSVWQYRFDTLLALKADLKDELELMNEFARENLKSYQVWHHRLLLIKHLAPSSLLPEISFIHASLLPDPKNYHTWAYLHWLYAYFSSSEVVAVHGPRIGEAEWEAERKWSEEMVEADGRNNSAWSWRWFLVFGREGAKGGEEEIEYALDEIRKIPHNASAWNYLRGAHKHLNIPFSRSLSAVLPFTTIPHPLSTAHKSAPTASSSSSAATSPLPVPFALEWMADCSAENGDLRTASGLYKDLGDRWDVMRRSYWKYRAREAGGDKASSKLKERVVGGTEHAITA